MQWFKYFSLLNEQHTLVITHTRVFMSCLHTKPYKYNPVQLILVFKTSLSDDYSLTFVSSYKANRESMCEVSCCLSPLVLEIAGIHRDHESFQNDLQHPGVMGSLWTQENRTFMCTEMADL